MKQPGIGVRLRTLREAKGWSRKSIADQLHVTKTCITQWELGYRTPNVDMVDAYLRVIDESLTIGVPR